MNNLLGNATKFTSEGKITVQVNKNQEHFNCSVTDTGEGIPDDELPLIFDKFKEFQRSTCPGETGSGLGLAIAKKIVELHGGKIWVESEGRNNGSTFYFSLPLLK